MTRRRWSQRQKNVKRRRDEDDEEYDEEEDGEDLDEEADEEEIEEESSSESSSASDDVDIDLVNDEDEIDEDGEEEPARKIRAVSQRSLSDDEEESEPSRGNSPSPDDNDAVDIDLCNEEEPVPELVVPRRSTRQRTDLRTAFRLLRDGDLLGFLNSWIIRRDFAAAFTLLGSFGQGHREAAVTALWHLHWNGDLMIRSLQRCRIKGSCMACGLSRNLKYCFYLKTPEYDHAYFDGLDDQDDGEVKLLGIMGTHCFEVKFSALIRLANTCKVLLADIDRASFESRARGRLAPILETISQATANMANLYR